MKTLLRIKISTLLALLFTSSAMANFSPYPGFAQFPSENPTMKKYFDARKLAVKLMNDAAASDSKYFNTDEKKSIAIAAARKLLAARVYFSVNPFNEPCQKNANAYVDPDIPDTIFICGVLQNTLDKSDEKSIVEVSEILVHETAHLLGSTNECAASTFEYSVMQATVGKATPDSYNEYGKNCAALAAFKPMFRQYATASTSPSKKPGRANR